MNEERAKQLFLFGVGGIALLTIVGLVWAIVAGPNTRFEGRASVENNLRFLDENDPVKGAPDAKVIVRMFSDLQCPACRDAEPALKQIMEEMATSVKFIWNDFPLTQIHKNAEAAAISARCAEDQGKFWEYQSVLYEKQSEWEGWAVPTGQFVTYAKSLGMDEGEFTSCISQATGKAKVLADVEEGMTNTVRSTPTFFINNRRISGGMSVEEWREEIGKARAAVLP